MHGPTASSGATYLESGDSHSHHHHHHHHHSHKRTKRAGIAFAIAACLLLGWSLIPLASVGFFETRLVAIGTWLLAALACLLPRDGGPLPSGRAWCFIAATLALWCGLQLLPLPAGLPAFWRGDSTVFAQIASHATGRLRMAVVPYEAFHTGLHWAGLFALACAAAHRLRTKTAVRVLLAGFVLWAVLEGFFSLVHNIGPDVRLRGTFANPDAFGGLLAMTLPLTAALLLDRIAAYAATPSASFSHRGAAPRIAWMMTIAAAFLFQLVVLFFTGSRGATASASLSLLVLLAWCWTAFPARRKAFLGGLILLLCLVPVFFVHAQHLNVWERALDAEGELDTGIASRRRIWEAGLALVRDFPCGTGPGGTAQAMPIYQTDAHGRYRLDYAHNDTLQFLGDLGWPGGVMLLCGLLLLLRQGLRAVKTPAAGDVPLPWLERGTALALLAALVHSQSEFNLSARPPIQLMFALLAGILFAVPRDETRHGHGHSSRSHPPAWLLRGPVLLAAAAAIVLSLRAAVAYRDARAAAQAVGLATPATDSPLLLPTARTLPIPPGDPAMDRAARWGADSPFVRAVLASIPLSNHRNAVYLTAKAQAEAISARENVADDDDDDEESSTGDTALLLPSPAWEDTDSDVEADDDPGPAAPTPELMAQATLALRFEEAQAVRDAIPHADAALRLAPWSSQAMTDRAWLLLRATALRALPADSLDKAAAEAHADLDLAATLFPSDAYTLSDICAALSAEEKNEENLPLILELAKRAFALNPSAALSSMDRWWSVGIPIHPLVQIDNLPVKALRKLYRRALYAGDNAEADGILSLIELRTRPDAPLPPAASQWDSARLAAWERRQLSTRLWALRQRLRQNLLEGDWAAVAASAPDRSEARILRVRSQFDALSSSPMLLRLRLREWNNRNLLPLYGRIEWALAECAAGKNPELYRDIWAEAARHLPLPADQANRLPARIRNEFTPLANTVSAPGTATAAPAGSLELSFLGERLFLESIAIETPDSPSDAPRLLLAWRFEAPPTPSNLNFLIRLRDENRTLLFRRIRYFEKTMPAYYQGRPEPGSRHVSAIPLPRVANLAQTLELQLRDGKTRIFQDDLKSVLVLPWSAIPRIPPPASAPPAATD